MNTALWSSSKLTEKIQFEFSVKSEVSSYFVCSREPSSVSQKFQ